MGQDLQGLEAQIRALRTALDTEVKDRKAADEQVKLQLRGLAFLLADHSEATNHAIKYVNDVTANFTTKAETLHEAIEEFNDFLKLPPRSNSALAIWDAAFAALSMVMPVLRLTTAFKALETTAGIEMRAAKAFMKTPSLQARVTSAAVHGGDIAEVIHKGNEMRGKVAAARAPETGRPVNTTRKPVSTLLADREAVRAQINLAIDAVQAEFSNRVHSLLYGVPYEPRGGKLIDMAKRLMPPVPLVLGVDIDMLRRLYLYQMMLAWVPQNVTFQTTQMRGSKMHSVLGINNTQVEKFDEWFGIGSIAVSYDNHGTVPMWQVHMLPYQGLQFCQPKMSYEVVKPGIVYRR